MPTNPQEQNSATLRALSLLEMIVGSESPVSLAEAVSHTGLPKPTVHRVLVLLERAGMLLREPNTKRYSPGRRLSSLALDTLLHPAPRVPRHAILRGRRRHLLQPVQFLSRHLLRLRRQWRRLDLLAQRADLPGVRVGLAEFALDRAQLFAEEEVPLGF